MKDREESTITQTLRDKILVETAANFVIPQILQVHVFSEKSFCVIEET